MKSALFKEQTLISNPKKREEVECRVKIEIEGVGSQEGG